MLFNSDTTGKTVTRIEIAKGEARNTAQFALLAKKGKKEIGGQLRVCQVNVGNRSGRISFSISHKNISFTSFSVSPLNVRIRPSIDQK
jgi:hypothetical protein